MMKRVLWLLVSLLALATPVAAQPEVDAYKIFLGPTGSTCIFSQGAAAPEGAVMGSVCDLYLQTTTSPSLWVKSTGTNTTTLWLKMVLPGSGAGLTGPANCVPYLSAIDTQSCYTYFTFNGTGGLGISTDVDTTMIQLSRSAADTDSPIISLMQSRGTTAAKTTTVTGDLLGQVYFWGRASGGTNVRGAGITAASSGTIGATKVPGELNFYTARDSDGSLRLRLTINNAGAFAFSAGSYGTAGQIPQSAGSSAEIAWTTATYPSTVTDDQILHGTATNVVGGLSTFTYNGTTLKVANSTASSIEITSNGSAGTTGSPINLDLDFKGYSGGTLGRIRTFDRSASVDDAQLSFWTKATGGSITERARFDTSGNFGIGLTSSISARLHVISTTEQLRLGYDASNYLSVTVASTGGTTLNATGAGAAFTFSDAATFSGAVTHSVAVTDAGATLLTGVISPTQLVANTDNWNPTGLSTANVIRINVDAARNITGIVAQTSGTMILLYNTTAFTVTLTHDATSTAANRFYAPGAANFALTQKKSVWIRYDGTHTRWTIIG